MKKNILLISIFSLIISHSYAAVSFNLNTSTALGFTDSTHAIVIRGSLNGWAGNDWALTNVGGDYWTYTSDTLSDGTYEYKYVMINDTGDNWESTNNRALTVSGTTDLPQDYWESDTTPPYTETDTVDVWFRVSTAGIADYAGATMYIAGNMNGWSGVALAPEGDSTFWSGQYSFASTTSLEYKFQHGEGGWEGVGNRTATVSSDTTLAFVYFNNTPPTDVDPVNVTFNLNTSTAPGFTDSTNTLVIRGSMNGWAGYDWELTNVGGDYWSYTTTSPMAMGNYEYKFVMVDELGNDNWESTDNRILSLANATTDVSIWLDYWENGQTPPYTPTDNTDVWFRVSTAGIVAYDGETMHIAGTMNGWGAEPLTQEGDSEFWSGQYSFAAGTAIEYKFLVDSDGWESIDNRTATVTSDTTLAFAYWNNSPPSDVQPVTKTVIFSVDMSEWLDEEGATGMPIFSVARGDTMQLRGGFNGWNCDDPADCILSRTPGTNIFSLALTLTDLPDHDNEYKFYMQHSAESIAQFVAEYGDMYGDMGWEDSPQYGGANRIFHIGEDDGTGLLELPLAGYYDLPAGAVIPAGQEVSVTFSVDMTGASADGFDAAEDTVYLFLKDKWLNYLQGFGDNSSYQATPNGDGTYSVTVDFMGPIPWHMIYTWGFSDVSEMVNLEEGGGFGFGRFRARYQHANADDDCAWGDYTFPGDIWQLDPPLPLENYDPESVCSPLYGGWLSNGGFEDGIAGWYPYPDDNGSYAIEETGNNIYNSSDIFEAYEGSHSLKMWGQYSGSENYGSFGQWFEVGADELEVGSTVELNGMLMSHADDWIGQGWNSAYLIFYFYESDYTMIGWEMSSLIDSYSSSSEWIPLSVTATVPENTFQVWAGVEYYQASNDDHGSVYVDSVTMNVETLSTGDENNLPKQFILHDNYPNPFNPTTNIAFSIPEASDVKIYIYNILGQTVAVIDKGHLNAGNYDIRWSGMDQLGKTLSSGIYFYEMQAGDQFKQIKKMTLVK